MDKSFVDNIEATGLMPAPTAESILSRASSRNNVDEVGIETTQQDILQAQADLKLPPPSPKKKLQQVTSYCYIQIQGSVRKYVLLNVSSVVECQRWWVLKCKRFD